MTVQARVSDLGRLRDKFEVILSNKERPCVKGYYSCPLLPLIVRPPKGLRTWLLLNSFLETSKGPAQGSAKQLPDTQEMSASKVCFFSSVVGVFSFIITPAHPIITTTAKISSYQFPPYHPTLFYIWGNQGQQETSGRSTL